MLPVQLGVLHFAKATEGLEIFRLEVIDFDELGLSISKLSLTLGQAAWLKYSSRT